jgi:formylglycine-generating enzyme required for sulfatase activity
MGAAATSLPLLLTIVTASLSAAEPTWSADLGNGISLELVLVRSGSFTQGSPESEPTRGADETQRQVTLRRDFYLGKFPVTRGQFARFIAATGYRTEAETGTSGGFGWNGSALVQNKQYNWRNPGFAQTDDHPVTGVTFADAQRFCQWLNGKLRRPFQLPTEAEWEYACRAGTTTAWHNGDDVRQAAEIAWFKSNAENATHPVASRKPNAWGLHISGNVYEWCRDWFGPYAAGPVTDPEQTNPNLSDKPRRVLRGGSWLGDVSHTRSAARYRNTPASRNADNGFRVLTYALEPAAAPAVPLERPQGAAAPQSADRSPLPGVPRSQTFHLEHSGSFSFAALLCPLLGFGMAILVVVIVIRSLVRSAANRAGVSAGARPPRALTSYGPLQVRTELGDDGFWLLADATMSGFIIHYLMQTAGQERAGQILCQPGADGRQFVYTGARPDQVVIIKAEATEDGGDAPPVISRDADSDFDAADLATPIILSESMRSRPVHRPSAY